VPFLVASSEGMAVKPVGRWLPTLVDARHAVRLFCFALRVAWARSQSKTECDALRDREGLHLQNFFGVEIFRRVEVCVLLVCMRLIESDDGVNMKTRRDKALEMMESEMRATVLAGLQQKRAIKKVVVCWYLGVRDGLGWS
jgi:hypothetical protein